MRSVLAVMKDHGGMQAVMPVVAILRRLGVQITLVTNGKATNLLSNQGEEVMTYQTAEEALKQLDPFPDILLTSMCSEGGIGRDLVPLLRKYHPSIRVVALQDSWGTRLWTDWALPKYRPDFICVNDQIGTELVKRAWPDFNTEHIKVLGYAMFDQYAHIDRISACKSARKKLDLDHNQRVILYCGQTVASGQTLYELIQTLSSLEYQYRLMPRQHPRMATDAPSIEAELWHKAEDEARYPLLRTTCTPMEAIAASDLVIGMFSTMLVEAACLRKPTVSIMYPKLGQAWFEKVSDGGQTRYPLESLGACSTARDPKQLREVLEEFFQDGTLHQEFAQKNAFPLDGKNAERIAEFVYALVSH